MSRTNVVLNDALLKEAFKYAYGVTTKRELLDVVLREFVENHRRRDIRELRGKIKLKDDYEYKTLRHDPHED